MRKPGNLRDLWRWAHIEGINALPDAPYQLHTKHYPKNTDPGPVRQSVIRGQPFSSAFERYLGNDRAKTPCRRALLGMAVRRRGGNVAPSHLQAPEFRILFGIVEAGYSDEQMPELRAVLGMDEGYFTGAAHRALSYLYDKTQRLEADEAKRRVVEHGGKGLTA